MLCNDAATMATKTKKDKNMKSGILKVYKSISNIVPLNKIYVVFIFFTLRLLHTICHTCFRNGFAPTCAKWEWMDTFPCHNGFMLSFLFTTNIGANDFIPDYTVLYSKHHGEQIIRLIYNTLSKCTYSLESCRTVYGMVINFYSLNNTSTCTTPCDE